MDWIELLRREIKRRYLLLMLTETSTTTKAIYRNKKIAQHLLHLSCFLVCLNARKTLFDTLLPTKQLFFLSSYCTISNMIRINITTGSVCSDSE